MVELGEAVFYLWVGEEADVVDAGRVEGVQVGGGVVEGADGADLGPPIGGHGDQAGDALLVEPLQEVVVEGERGQGRVLLGDQAG